MAKGHRVLESKSDFVGGREAEYSRVLVTLPEDSGLVPSIPLKQLTTACT